MKLRAWLAVKAIAVAVMVLAMSLSAVGCGKQPAGTITEAGSTTVEPVAERLAGKYMQKHNDLHVITAGGGRAVGITPLGGWASLENA
jgi:phosphate transport system substrate-binding protein